MQRMFNFFLWLLLFSSCTNTNVVSIDELEGYQITQISPNIAVDGSIPDYDTATVLAYYYQGKVLYRLTYLYESENDSGITVPLERRNHFVAFKPGKAFGYHYDIHETPEKREVLVDSILKTEWIVRNDLFSMFKYGKPMLTGQVKKGDSLVESYRMFDTSTMRPMVDCKLVYSDRIPNVDLSICKQLDTVVNMKLCYMAFTADANYIRSKGIKSGIYRSEYHLKRIPVENRAELLRYFEPL